ncbi:ATP-binding cassette domain-containing protein [Brevundimonas sp. 2R-24]|uniref:ATP-binding cassette domain-containing protein n=1 Tax=Peiella sedimenti TaxID=3061083 RepID=A0ABT8SJ71_9CAUL|nr:ATP-binding cassette domain-containing protein [Caulobacteraceae bacterium XZ-24]
MAAAALLGLSGWFLTASAAAGLLGLAAAHAFNFMLPSALIRLLAIVRTAARYGERMSGHKAALDALAQLRPALFLRIASAAPERLMRLAGGEAAARLVQDVDALQTALVRRSAPWSAFGGMAAGGLMTLLCGWPAALVCGLAMVLALSLALVTGRRLAEPAGESLQARQGELKAELAMQEQAAPELRAYGLEGWARTRLAPPAAALDEATLRLARAEGWILAGQGVVMAAAATAVVLVSLDRPAPLVALAALAVLAAVEGAAAFAAAARDRGRSNAAEVRLGTLLDGALSDPAPAPRLKPVLTISGTRLEPGDRLAITGPSGCGKTTLVERLMRLREGAQGDLLLGGFDVAELPVEQVRRQFSYAPQHPRFITGTVRQNLMLSGPPASDADLWRALEDSCLAERFRQTGRGLDTLLEDDASILSGGERRRLAIARALLRPAPWLVLDEPTEGLDERLEAALLDRLDRRLGVSGQGLIVVSHRTVAAGLADVSTCLTRPAEEPVQA